MNNTSSFQLLSPTNGYESSTIQRAHQFMFSVNESSLKMLNAHSHNLYPRGVIDFNAISKIVPALGSVYVDDSLTSFLNLPKKDVPAYSSLHAFKNIKWDNHQIQLERPIEINLNFSGDLWECSNDELDIFLVDPDIEQLKKDFEEEFFVMWDVYSKESDDKLTEKARQIKYNILSFVKGVSVEDQN
ncbi:MAG: hypothetical protein Q7J10_10760 [Methanosarcinaceae archaeon]|nr:hypothetical protein [Methanosarcinaceae archaeon]